MASAAASTVVHIPHASRHIPADVREQFVLTGDAEPTSRVGVGKGPWPPAHGHSRN